MTHAGFKPTIPTGERPKTHALDRAANGIGVWWKAGEKGLDARKGGKASRRVIEPNQLHMSFVPGIKRPGREASALNFGPRNSWMSQDEGREILKL
jgi:hypothetical protein